MDEMVLEFKNIDEYLNSKKITKMRYPNYSPVSVSMHSKNNTVRVKLRRYK